MPAAYQVKRSEPLAVSDIEVTFVDDLPSNNTPDNGDQRILTEASYVRSISATITGRDITSEKRVTLGNMTADFLLARKALRSEYGLGECCESHSAALAMLFEACFSRSAIEKGNKPDDYNWGDVLMVESLRLEPQFRGYGIGLLAMDKLVQHVARASPGWGKEGLLVLAALGLTDDIARANDHGKIQEKLTQYYQLFGLGLLAQETKEHCAFLGLEMINWRPDIRTVVPHLLRDDTRRTARGRYRMMGGGKDYSLEILNRVAGSGNFEPFEHLVHRGADPSRSLALHRVSECNDATKVGFMIDHLLDKHHFDIEADNRQFLKTGPRPDFGTPLHCAIHNRNIDAVRHLLKRGADPKSGVGIAIGSNIIIREGWLPALDALLDARANVDRAFNQAVKFAKVEAAETCLIRGTMSLSVIQQTRPNPISSGSHAVFVEERAKMEAFLKSIR